MTIDELCAVIRKRRKRTGLAWVEGDLGRLRENDTLGCCPIVAAAGMPSWRNGDAETIGVIHLHMTKGEVRLVMDAADRRCGFTTDRERKQARDKLEAACLGPLE